MKMFNSFNLHFSALMLITAALYSCGGPTAENFNDYPIRPIDFTHVRLHEGFWKQRVEVATNVTIPFAFRKCEETGRIDNFIFAGGLKEGKFRGSYGFDDSDVYKIMEGASYSLMLNSDPEMESYLDTLVYYISEAQEDDGYIYTAWSLKANEYNDFKCCSYSDEGRFLALESSHELYNPGHLYEAAVAHFLATGKRSLLDVATRSADLIYDLCILQGNKYMPGHQEIEIGLVKLYRVTKDLRYLTLAKYFLDARGRGVNTKSAYNQAHKPVVDQAEAVGHAVRANYMYTAMADVAALTGDSLYLNAIDRIWEDVVNSKLSITGGVGARHRGEAYGNAYQLPNDPYNETCAAIANVYWNHRMFLLHGDARYVDVMERTLYNGVLSGISLDGDLFFYPNTLRCDGTKDFNKGHKGRAPWFDCSCCPSNLSRFLPSIAGYAYAVRGNEVFVNLFMNSEAAIETGQGTLNITQKTDYPWDGAVTIALDVEAPMSATLMIRLPGWAKGQPVPSDLFTYTEDADYDIDILINGRAVSFEEDKGYAVIKREWRSGDMISVELPLEIRQVVANDKVAAKVGLVAVECGPIVYCAEEIDNVQDVLDISINPGTKFNALFNAGQLTGVNMLTDTIGGIALVPYFAWNNRGNGKMNVWLKRNQ